MNKKITGWIMIIALFVGLFIVSIFKTGLEETIISTCFAALVLVYIMIATWLLSR